MSLVTRCPACATLFKVVPDQLRISDGWVRCGRCGEVFDGAEAAFAGVGEDAPTTLLPRTAPAPLFPTLPDPGPPAADPTPPYYYSSRASAPAPLETPEPAPAPVAAQLIDPAAPLPDEDDADPSPLLLHTAGDALREPEADAADASAGFMPSKPPPLADAEIDALVHAPAAVGFVRDAERRAFWRQPLVRAGLLLLCLLLAAALALQAAVLERDRVAATWPALRPVVEQACGVLGCRIGPWQQIDAVAIDSSSFVRTRGDAYQLRVALKNTAAVPVATPALELTLTDGSDQAVLRRVILPAELGAAAALPAAGEWAGATTVVVTGAASRVAGYRLLAFYP